MLSPQAFFEAGGGFLSEAVAGVCCFSLLHMTCAAPWLQRQFIRIEKFCKSCIISELRLVRRGGRVVEGGRLEIVLAVMSRYVGSNPTFSAIFTDCSPCGIFPRGLLSEYEWEAFFAFFVPQPCRK